MKTHHISLEKELRMLGMTTDCEDDVQKEQDQNRWILPLHSTTWPWCGQLTYSFHEQFHICPPKPNLNIDIHRQMGLHL